MVKAYSWIATSFLHYPFSLTHLSCFFSCMTNILRQMKKILIELMNRLQSESIFFFLFFFSSFLISLLFVHYSVIKLRYFWWNYFLNNFRLLIGLLKLVCLLMVGQIIDQQNVGIAIGTFSDDKYSSATVFKTLTKKLLAVRPEKVTRRKKKLEKQLQSFLR